MQNVFKAKDAVVNAIGIISVAFTGLSTVLDGVANVMNGVFGTNFTGQGLLIATAVLQLTGVFGGLAAAIELATAAAAFFLATPIGLAITALTILGVTLYQNWSTIGPLFKSIWDTMVAWAAWVEDKFVYAFNTAVAAVQSVFQGLWDGIKAGIAWVTNAINSVVDLASRAASSVTRALGLSGGGPARAFATGGPVRGPGSGTSDSILARISNGEFVMRTAAVRHWGVGFMHALNSMRNPLTEFAAGGLAGSLVPHSMPRFADGGMAADSGTPVHLHLSGQSFALSGSSNVVDALVSAAHAQADPQRRGEAVVVRRQAERAMTIPARNTVFDISFPELPGSDWGQPVLGSRTEGDAQPDLDGERR